MSLIGSNLPRQRPKTESSKSPMPVDLALEKLLAEHRRRLPSSLQESQWVFPSKRTEKPSQPWSGPTSLAVADWRKGRSRETWLACISAHIFESAQRARDRCQGAARTASSRPERLRTANSKLVRLLLFAVRSRSGRAGANWASARFQ